MNSKLTKTALVTGANRGIGFAVCQGLLEANFRVIIGLRILEKGIEAAEKFNSPLVSAVEIDLKDSGKLWRDRSIISF